MRVFRWWLAVSSMWTSFWKIQTEKWYTKTCESRWTRFPIKLELAAHIKSASRTSFPHSLTKLFTWTWVLNCLHRNLKYIFFQWQTGDESLGRIQPTPRLAAMTQLESASSTIGDRLRVVDDYQTHHRLREATGRKRAEELSERVLLWSLGQTAIVIIIGIGQVTQ